MTTVEKIQRFAKIVEAQELAALLRLCGSTKGNEKSYLASIKPRRKYVLVDVGTSGRYIIDGENVYGCKAYGVIHRGHFFGTLDQILANNQVARHLVG